MPIEKLASHRHGTTVPRPWDKCPSPAGKKSRARGTDVPLRWDITDMQAYLRSACGKGWWIAMGFIYRNVRKEIRCTHQLYFVRPVFVLGAKGAHSDKAKLIRR
jgi:hypothetical protein